MVAVALRDRRTSEKISKSAFLHRSRLTSHSWMQKVLAAGGNTERAWTSSSWRSFIGPHVFRTVENVTAREYINCNSSSPAISPAAFPPLDPKPMLAMPCDQALLSFAGTPHEASPADAADGVRSLSFWHAKLISVRPTGFLWALFRHC